jgi:hypothetical protein
MRIELFFFQILIQKYLLQAQQLLIRFKRIHDCPQVHQATKHSN